VSSSNASSAERPGPRSGLASDAARTRRVALLTGGKDAHYARGLARELAARGVRVALAGSREEMPGPDEAVAAAVDFHDLVGSLDPQAALPAKVARILRYYVRLLMFVVRTDARLVHILWFRKFPTLERIVLALGLQVLGKKLVFTAHNVDDHTRDGARGSLAHRLSLRLFYHRVDHVLVHTRRMQDELAESFGLPADRVTVIPLGINDVVPIAAETRLQARRKLGFDADDRVLLLFGNIAPYKGVEDAVRALAEVVPDERVVLVIAGPVKDRSCEAYWRDVTHLIETLGVSAHVRTEIRRIPDDEVGLWFRAADVSLLPYRRVYQSGVLGLSYAQGRPVIAADVGAMREDILKGETGLLFRPGDTVDLAATIRAYFASDLFRDLEARGPRISNHGAQRFSWHVNADRTCAVYDKLLR
jgi:D-inositol-3-phosphate glycosyltransferase